MYAVIFRATIAAMDDDYKQAAERLRQLAMEKYGCSGFSSVTEGDVEIAISYWEDAGRIKAWKMDPEHVQAQERGKAKWYSSYHVQVVKVLREYAGAV